MTGTRRDGIQRRDALLDAALRCFTERGVLATGIEDIRKAAGASPSSVYHLFGGLAGIVEALLIRTFERSLAHLVTRLTEAATAEAAVRALVDGHLEWVVAHPDEARFMYQAMAVELAGDSRAAVLAAKDAVKRPLFDRLARFDLPAWPPLTLEFVLLGPTHEACRRYLAGEDVDLGWMRMNLPELAWRSIE
ncbi:MAG: TetR family transcriptional regulator [Actinophytocola sp.]|uniref:TetR/AcrR family transcriptional regulator n=1 Tax=Actinophytocola sp. TaxID=1872138 RepID=UPI001327D50E|nr:TetR/AcrR family transcriptional regulator [Actinophytocola sp.]MPZ82818.1 TetR family transcriptional regulator [Actinophytocola sp.]